MFFYLIWWWIKGFALTSGDFLPNNYFAIGKYSISCCAADVGFVGFMVENNQNFNIKENEWYELYGILSIEDDNSFYHTLKVIPISIKEIDKRNEEYYVYLCYYYNSCEKLSKYSLSEKQ